ncbi:hypothetical protein JQK62_18810, partial [Leptospira santarosai]|nr:hypothetical protein [Leptospira santarosai]
HVWLCRSCVKLFLPNGSKEVTQIAFDDAYSRLYAGVHFEADNTEGLNLGRYIGNMIVDHLKTQKDEDGQPIDHPYREYRNANISPDDYKQFIPFDFKDDCTSRLRAKKAKESKEIIESIESIESSIESIESIDDQKSHQKHIPRRSPWHF